MKHANTSRPAAMISVKRRCKNIVGRLVAICAVLYFLFISILSHLPESVREATTTNPVTGRRRRKPLKIQWAVFEWLAMTLSQWTRQQFAAGGDDIEGLPWRLVVHKILDVCRGLLHLHNHNVVCVSSLQSQHECIVCVSVHSASHDSSGSS